jgi:hypothetical protein
MVLSVGESGGLPVLVVSCEMSGQEYVVDLDLYGLGHPYQMGLRLGDNQGRCLDHCLLLLLHKSRYQEAYQGRRKGHYHHRQEEEVVVVDRFAEDQEPIRSSR